MSDHWTYVALSYGVAFVVVGGIALRIIFDHRRLKRELERLDSGADSGDGA